MIHYTDPEATIYEGDWIENLRLLPDNSVHCIVTSPPYWGLRNYGCKGQLGMEKTPEEYIRTMVAGFAELHRVLRHDGTLWLNMGDTYAGGGNGGGGSFAKDGIRAAKPGTDKNVAARTGKRGVAGTIKHKDLAGIPWLLAFALREWGWYLRQDIVWAKPNPMPESVRDRCTKSHEYIFLLTKKPRYYYDQEAIFEDCSESTHLRLSQDVANQIGSERAVGKTNGNIPSNWHQSESLHNEMPGRDFGGSKVQENNDDGVKCNHSFAEATCLPVGKRNKRSVWEVATKGYKNAHFATFPPDLIKPCILAGTSEHGCCAECGSPYSRITKKGKPNLIHQLACGSDASGEYHGQATKEFELNGAQNASAVKSRILEGMAEKITVGWKKNCKCDCARVVPCTVLDPFGGSGTTAEVALKERRRAILIELNPKYLAFIKERVFSLPLNLL